MMDDFSHDLWSNVTKLFDENRQCEALYTLYNELRLELLKKNYIGCNEFLIYMYNQETIGTDSIVHMLNILSEAKDYLIFWDEFLKNMDERLVEQEGAEEAKTLLKVIL